MGSGPAPQGPGRMLPGPPPGWSGCWSQDTGSAPGLVSPAPGTGRLLAEARKQLLPISKALSAGGKADAHPPTLTAIKLLFEILLSARLRAERPDTQYRKILKTVLQETDFLPLYRWKQVAGCDVTRLISLCPLTAPAYFESKTVSAEGPRRRGEKDSTGLMGRPKKASQRATRPSVYFESRINGTPG